MLGAPSCRHSPHSYHYLGATGPFSESFDSHGSETDPPHGGVRTFHQKSTCLTQLTFGPYVVQIWSRNPQSLRQRNPSSNSTVWKQEAADWYSIQSLTAGQTLQGGAADGVSGATQWSTRVSGPPKLWGDVTKFKPDEAV